MAEQIQNGDMALVHYTGRLEDGQVFDSSIGGAPLEFEVGAGQVISGFDTGIKGMQVGEKKTIEIEADEAYGKYNSSLVQSIPRDNIQLDTEPEVGMQLMMQLPGGEQLPVAITEVSDSHITLDANHPLAGQKLIFDVELVQRKAKGAGA
jgi:FKBP-type peptidyl-prolyl cis-trans isomerase 2